MIVPRSLGVSTVRERPRKNRPSRRLLPGATPGELGPYPPALEPRVLLSSLSSGMSRSQAAEFFNTVYQASEGVDPGWNGNVATGNAGTLSPAFLEAIRTRVNWFRTMAGLPGTVVLDPALNAKSQQAALMMSANRTLSHSPTPDWTYYTTAGAEAAGHSNLSLGLGGPDAIDGFMRDEGAGNAAVGHRRWILHPPQRTMGVGSIPVGNWPTAPTSLALWVLGGYGNPNPPSTPEAVAWPPAGHVPYQTVSQRWSISYAWGGGDFSSATVTMTRDGVPVPVTVISRTDNGYGNNTLVWEPRGAGWPFSGSGFEQPDHDVTYAVTVDHVAVGSGFKSFSYATTVFAPDSESPPGVSTARFSASTAEFGESAGVVPVDLVRDGDLSSAATVWYSTSDGTARAGTDYVPLNGSVQFEAGEARRTIFVSILNDRVKESGESFVIALDQASGTTLASPSSITLRIIDDDAPPARIQRVRRVGGRSGLTRVVLTFSDSMDPATASSLSGYQLRRAGRDRRFGTGDDMRLPLRRVVLDRSARTVTLVLARPFRGREKLVLAVSAQRVRSRSGAALDGNRDGLPGGDAAFLL